MWLVCWTIFFEEDEGHPVIIDGMRNRRRLTHYFFPEIDEEALVLPVAAASWYYLSPKTAKQSFFYTNSLQIA